METKFILHGGMTSRNDPHNDTFFTEISKGLQDGDKILFVGFARKTDEEQERVYQRDKKVILSHTDKALIVEKAQLQSFATQITQADVIYVTGGVTKILKERLLSCPDFSDRIKGKTYAGSSAGANVVSLYHTSGFVEGIQEGLGILPLCVMAHYGNPEFNAVDENKHWFYAYSKNCELLLLPECQWVIRKYNL